MPGYKEFQMKLERENSEFLMKQLYKQGAIKFGKFKLALHKTNPDAPLSPIYIEFSNICSPILLREFAKGLLRLKRKGLVGYDVIVGVPSGGIPLATLFAAYSARDTNILAHRKDKDEVGGIFQSGQTALVIEDVITSGKSTLKTIMALENAGLTVKNALVVIDREQGGVQNLEKAGYKVHSVFKITELLDFYLKEKKITPEKYKEILEYITNNKTHF